ncbi:MAG: DUF521 domain-containing protein [Spirochaetes bacterium]|nr:DUF521 domain-containing protein [Spirochaetota bacterium]
MYLTNEEKEMLNGAAGAVVQKAMKTIVSYGDIFDADRLVPITGAPHFVISVGTGVMKPYYDMLDELIDAGLTMRMPFTVDPRPVDFSNVSYNPAERVVTGLIYRHQKKYEEQLLRLGLKSLNSFSCASYQEEAGNTPRYGDMLAWSESSAVVYVNSVIGARTNRNSAGIDVLCNILGKAPNFDLLTDRGREATWRIDVRTGALPNPQLLGSAIGMKVVEHVPYITGLDAFLGTELVQPVKDYLKDMGAACASNGAVGLFHVENLTPEAGARGRSLLAEGHQTYVIDDAELERVMSSYPVMWKRPDKKPKKCFIGCPHLSLAQLRGWVEAIDGELESRRAGKVRLETVLCAPPDVIDAFHRDRECTEKQKRRGITVSGICPLMYMTDPLSAMLPIVTNSNKLRTYTTARFYPDEDILKIIRTGRLPV